MRQPHPGSATSSRLTRNKPSRCIEGLLRGSLDEVAEPGWGGRGTTQGQGGAYNIGTRCIPLQRIAVVCSGRYKVHTRYIQGTYKVQGTWETHSNIQEETQLLNMGLLMCRSAKWGLGRMSFNMGLLMCRTVKLRLPSHLTRHGVSDV
jgi:hypothetical protein